MRRTSRLLVPLLAALALSACATGSAERDAERLALYRAHAGAQVDSIQYTHSYNGWTPLGDGAVSYTHLDVYKRQVMVSLSNPSARRAALTVFSLIGLLGVRMLGKQ